MNKQIKISKNQSGWIYCLADPGYRSVALFLIHETKRSLFELFMPLVKTENENG